MWTVQSDLRGEIATVPNGEFGFGYDPIFLVSSAGKTLAQMSASEKNRVSARGKALQELRTFLVSR